MAKRVKIWGKDKAYEGDLVLVSEVQMQDHFKERRETGVKNGFMNQDFPMERLFGEITSIDEELTIIEKAYPDLLLRHYGNPFV